MKHQMLLNPWISHFIVFFLGGAAIFPYDQPCRLDITGVAIEITGKQKKFLNGYERNRAIYPLHKQAEDVCLLSQEAFYLFENDKALWALFPGRKTSIPGIQAFLEGKVNFGSRGIKSYPGCNSKHRVIYE
jgi:hypothetical protein